MVKTNIGVIAFQGAISEHIDIIKKAQQKKNIFGKVVNIKRKEQLKDIDRIIIPGGESTTISKLLVQNNLFEIIKKKINEKELYAMGTCAGCVLLSKKVLDDKKDIKLFNSIDIEVIRNYYGRQKDSFERKINIRNLTDSFNAVFIRAPAIEKIDKKCEILSKYNEKIIMVRQDNVLALTFHPELTNDSRIHEYFLDMI